MMRPISRDIPAPVRVDAGAAPMLQWIDIDKLVVDETYQRDFLPRNAATSAKIAAAFDWSKFLTVHVAPIEGGLFAIIDGQHRTHAAAACGFTQVPCQVTPMSRQQQAAAFSAINGEATAVNAIQLFRAAIAAEEPWAVEVRDVCARAGCVAMTSNKSANMRKPREIFTPMFLRRLIAASGPHPVEAALTIVRHSGKTGADPATCGALFLRPLLSALVTRRHVLRQRDVASQLLAGLRLRRLLDEADLINIARVEKELPRIATIDALEATIGDAIDKGMPMTTLTATPKGGDA